MPESLNSLFHSMKHPQVTVKVYGEKNSIVEREGQYCGCDPSGILIAFDERTKTYIPWSEVSEVITTNESEDVGSSRP